MQLSSNDSKTGNNQHLLKIQKQATDTELTQAKLQNKVLDDHEKNLGNDYQQADHNFDFLSPLELAMMDQSDGVNGQTDLS